MTYKEIKDRLTKCEKSLLKIKATSSTAPLSKETKAQVAKLELLKESLTKKLDEAQSKTYLVTPKSGQTTAVSMSDDETDALKDADDVKAIKGIDGEEVKERLNKNKGTVYSVEDTKAIAKKVGLACAKGLKSLGDEISHMKAKHIEENSFEIYVEYKKDNKDDTFAFHIQNDNLHLADFSFNKVIGQVGTKPSGEAIVQVDVIANELQKHWKSMAESMSDEEWADAKEKERLDKHPEKDIIRKIQSLVAKEKTKKLKELTKEGEGDDHHYLKVSRRDYKKAMSILDNNVDPTYVKTDIVDDDGAGNVIIYFIFRHEYGFDDMYDDPEGKENPEFYQEPDEDPNAFMNDVVMDLQANGIEVVDHSAEMDEDYDPDQEQKDDEEDHGVAYDDDGRPLGETDEATDINDPVLMRMRVAKKRNADLKKVDQMHARDRKDQRINGRKRLLIKQLKDKRAEIEREMENDPEIEPQGGPVADRYGDMLNKIDNAIEKAAGRIKPIDYDTAVGKVNEEDGKLVTFGYDLNRIEDVVKHLQSKYKEGQDFELHIGRGDDLPNAVTLKNPSLQKDHDLNDMLNAAQSDEDRYDAYTDDDLNENQPTVFDDESMDALLQIILKYVEDPNDAEKAVQQVDDHGLDSLSDELTANLERDPEFEAWYNKLHSIPDADTDYMQRRRADNDYMEEGEDLDVGHQDDEPHMLKKDLYDVITYASKLYKALDKYDNARGEVDFPHWWQKKVTLAREYMSSAQHYLEGEEKQPAIDQLALEHVIKSRGLVKEGTDLYDKGGLHIKRFSGGKRGVMVQITYGTQYIQLPVDKFPILARAMQSVQGDLEDMNTQIPRRKNIDEVRAAKVQKAYGLVVAKMKELAKQYKAGDKSVIPQLKDLTAKKKALEADLERAVAGTHQGQELTELTSDQRNELVELQNILDELSQKGEEAREIIRQHFPRMLSKGDAYGAFEFGSSANRYDTTLESIIEEIEEYYDEEEDEMDEGRKDNDALYPDNPRLPKIKNLADKIVSMVKAEADKGELGYIKTMEELRYQQEDDFERTPEWNKAKGIKSDFDDYGNTDEEYKGKHQGSNYKWPMSKATKDRKEADKKTSDKKTVKEEIDGGRLFDYFAKQGYKIDNRRPDGYPAKEGVEGYMVSRGNDRYPQAVIFQHNKDTDEFTISRMSGYRIDQKEASKAGMRQAGRSGAAGMDSYMTDGNYNPVGISAEGLKDIVDHVMTGLDREAKAQGDFYKGRGNTSGTIDEGATCCGKCGRVHVKGSGCKRPYLKGSKHCRTK